MKINRIALFFIAFLSISCIGIFSHFLVWASDETNLYKAKIEACLEARKTSPSQARKITDYICADDAKLSDQSVAYQVILDGEMRKIDKKIRMALEKFQDQKTKDVVDMQKTIGNWFDRTGEKESFAHQYDAVCNNLTTTSNPFHILMETFSSANTDNDTSNFLDGQNRCTKLTNKKLDAYRDIAKLIALDNTVKNYENDKDEFTLKTKEEYARFLEQWKVYIGHLARLKQKFPSKTRVTN